MDLFGILKQRNDSSSLVTKIYKEIRTAILTGDIPGGTRLVESALAEKSGVSKTPVREALHKLTSEGLLYTIPRAGYIVEELSEPDIEDLFETRAAIEQLAGQWAMKNITDEELALLEENLERTDEVLDSGSTLKMIDLDVDFHRVIHRATKSKYIYRICQNLSDHTLKFRIAVIHVPEIAQRVKENHFKIYRALKLRNPKQVEKSIAFHLEEAKKVVLKYLKQLRQDSFMSREKER